MPTYELVVGGETRERVVTVADSYEDTRLGLAAAERKDGEDGWRVQPDPAAPATMQAAQDAPDPDPPKTKKAAAGSGG